MIRTLAGLLLLVALEAAAQVPVARVADDALVIDRVAEASKKDLPVDLLKRIVTEDIELLRGKRSDGTYQYANWERLEASRTTESFSLNAASDKMQTVEVKGAWVYRIVLDVPTRKMLVRKNRPVWVEQVDVDYTPQGSSKAERLSVEVKALMQPGEVRPIDLPAVAQQATVRVVAAAQENGGYGNLDVAVVMARIVDNSDSPYADAIASAKSILRGLERSDVASIRSMAQRMRTGLVGARTEVPPTASQTVAPQSSGSTIEVTGADRASQIELQAELQLIEDLLTGSESERREGLDRLHQLVRRMR